VTGFASPNRLRLQVFPTSWRLHPPHVCRPYFMPDPLLGFALQSFPPTRAAWVPSPAPVPSCRWKRSRTFPRPNLRRKRRNAAPVTGSH